jgi:hypothetical protein
MMIHPVGSEIQLAYTHFPGAHPSKLRHKSDENKHLPPQMQGHKRAQ